MTGNQLIDAVAGELDRPDLLSAGANKVASQGALNDTLRDFLNRYPWTWRVSADPVDVQADTTKTVFDATAASPFVMDIYGIVMDDGTVSTKLMREISLNDYLQKWGNVDFLPQDRPTEYAKVSATKFKVAPKPQDNSYIFRCFVSYQFADITDFDLQITDVPERALEAVKVGVLARLYRWIHEFDKASSIYSLFGEQIQTLIKEDETAPNLEFRFQEAVFAVKPISINYWQSPFIRGV